MSLINDIAAAVVADVNGAPSGTFGQAFTAVQAYLPQYELADMKNLHVTVVPKGVTMRLFGDSHDYLAKGLSGGRIIVRPPEESPLEADEPRDAAESRGADDFLLSFL